MAFYDKPMLKFTRMLEQTVVWRLRRAAGARFPVTLSVWLVVNGWIYCKVIREELPNSGRIAGCWFAEHRNHNARERVLSTVAAR